MQSLFSDMSKGSIPPTDNIFIYSKPQLKTSGLGNIRIISPTQQQTQQARSELKERLKPTIVKNMPMSIRKKRIVKSKSKTYKKKVKKTKKRIINKKGQKNKKKIKKLSNRKRPVTKTGSRHSKSPVKTKKSLKRKR